jgi:hypothetical protein
MSLTTQLSDVSADIGFLHNKAATLWGIIIDSQRERDRERERHVHIHTHISIVYGIKPKVNLTFVVNIAAP